MIIQETLEETQMYGTSKPMPSGIHMQNSADFKPEETDILKKDIDALLEEVDKEF